MPELHEVDLRTDLGAQEFIKHETVSVSFATAAGVLTSRVGQNHYVAGDALLTGADGDCWCGSRDRHQRALSPGVSAARLIQKSR